MIAAFTIHCQGCGAVLVAAQAVRKTANLNPAARQAPRASFEDAWRATVSTLISCSKCKLYHVYRGQPDRSKPALVVETFQDVPVFSVASATG